MHLNNYPRQTRYPLRNEMNEFRHSYSNGDEYSRQWKPAINHNQIHHVNSIKYEYKINATQEYQQNNIQDIKQQPETYKTFSSSPIKQNNQIDVLADFILGAAWSNPRPKRPVQVNEDVSDHICPGKNRDDGEERRIEPQAQKTRNLLLARRTICINNFERHELANGKDNSILFEIAEPLTDLMNLIPIKLKRQYSKQVKQLILLELEILVECSRCHQLIQTTTSLIQKTKAPAIRISHCQCTKNIEFQYNDSQKWERLENEVIIGYAPIQDLVITKAEFDVRCSCGKIQDAPLVLDQPISLENGKYFLIADEFYRKLCRNCCKEVILQDCELYI